MRDHYGAIVDPAIAPQRRADDEGWGQIFAGGTDRLDPGLSSFQQGSLHMQIVQRIGGQTHFRIKQQIDMAIMRHLRLLDDPLGIVDHVGCARARRGRGRAHETVAVHVEEIIGIAGHHCSCQWRVVPVAGLTYAEFGETFLYRRARNFALGFPAVDGLRAPWWRFAIAQAKFLRREGRVMALPPIAD